MREVYEEEYIPSKSQGLLEKPKTKAQILYEEALKEVQDEQQKEQETQTVGDDAKEVYTEPNQSLQ